MTDPIKEIDQTDDNFVKYLYDQGQNIIYNINNIHELISILNQEISMEKIERAALRAELYDMKSQLDAFSKYGEICHSEIAKLNDSHSEIKAKLEYKYLELNHAGAKFQQGMVAAVPNPANGELLQNGRETCATETALAHELDVCRRMQGRALFILGFARSSTTVTLQIFNSSKDVFLLGEANFYLRTDKPRFRDWYNSQHILFGNQETKSSYAPDFIPIRDHHWYEWLDKASDHYDIVGEKIAFSAFHFSVCNPKNIKEFYEARFFGSRYVFMIRNPIDTLLSTANLLGISQESQMMEQCKAWLAYIQLWADWIRVFPHTMTIVTDHFTEATVDRLALFTGLDLEKAKALYQPSKVHSHSSAEPQFTTLIRLRSELMSVFDEAVQAAQGGSVLWQAEQKRGSVQDVEPISGNVSQPLGRAWTAATELRARLEKEGALNEKDVRGDPFQNIACDQGS